jgi:hypothetical protein
VVASVISRFSSRINIDVGRIDRFSWTEAF